MLKLTLLSVCPFPHLITTDSINQLDIVDGLKELVIRKRFTLKLVLDTPVSGLANILGIDNYVANIISNAVRKAVDQHT